MVKAVIGEETQLKLSEDRLSQSGVPSQVGLVIGKLSATLDRGFVFDLIPTPPNDAGEPACSVVESGKDDKKKGSKGKSSAESSSLAIDKDWVAEHARQVSRMLLGGMKVVGIYIWVNEGAFKNSTVILCQTVKGVAEAAPLLGTDWDERLLVHISYSPRRWMCRNCSLASNITSSSLRPCDFKMGKVLASLQTFRCTYNFDVRLPIYRENALNLRRLADILRHEISTHGRELKGAKALIDGKLVSEDEQCVLDGSHVVEFLLPFTENAYVEAQKEVVGVLVFSGSVCSISYLNSKEPISQALVDIKGDIITSLQSRLDIICDEAEGELNPVNEISTGNPIPQLDLQLSRNHCHLPFPRRVFVPWLAGTYICDYIQSSETLEVLKDHFVELMAMEPPTDNSTILELEKEAPSLIAKSFCDVVMPYSSTSSPDSAPSKKKVTNTSKQKNQKSEKSAGFNFMASFSVLVLAILIGLVLFFANAS